MTRTPMLALLLAGACGSTAAFRAPLVPRASALPRRLGRAHVALLQKQYPAAPGRGGRAADTAGLVGGRAADTARANARRGD
jgi:hypothetical protein